MPDGAQMNLSPTARQALELTDALTVLQSPDAEGPLDVIIGDRVILFSSEDVASGSALQRLVGLARLLSVASEQPAQNVQALRLRNPVLHPGVAEILDALRQ